MDAGVALYDRLGVDFTLLSFGGDTAPVAEAFADAGVPLDVLDIEDAAAATLYERRLVLVGPDQHVLWRGDAPPDDAAALARTVAARA